MEYNAIEEFLVDVAPEAPPKDDAFSRMQQPGDPLHSDGLRQPLPTREDKAAPTIAFADPDAGTTTRRLVRPLIVDGQRLDQITMRRPTLGDIEDLDTGAIGRGELLERLTGLSRKVLRALDTADADTLLVAFNGEVGLADDGGAS